MLAEQAVDQIGKMKEGEAPTQYTAAEWKDYLQSTEAAAKSILDYAKNIRGHRSPD